jgi:hypothetical protein
MSTVKTAYFFLQTPILVAQPPCHVQGVRFGESKILSERKNFELVGS